MYEKQNFKPGQKLKASELNHMEEGIANAVSVEHQTLSEAQKSQARKNLDLDDIADGNGIEEITIESVGEPKPNPSENVYQLNFKLDDGSVQSVQFTAPQGPKGDTGAPGAHIGPEAPTNGEKLWVDTDEAPEESETEGGTQIDVVAKAGQLLSVAEVDADGKPTKWQAVDLPKAETPDWNANEGEKGYIEGRTHYVDAKGVVHKLPNKFIDADWMATSRVNDQSDYIIVKEQTVTSMWSGLDERLQPGFVYDVYINDMLYACEAFNEDGGICLGNNTSLTKNSYPFCIYWAGGSAKAGFFYKDSEVLGSSVLLKVTHHSYTEYNKLPVDFLPDEAAQKTDVAKAIEEKDTETKAYIEQYVEPIITSVAANSNAIEKKITAPTAAAVGQTIIVEEVDAEGKPTKWKSADYQPRTHWSEVNRTVLFDETVTVTNNRYLSLQPIDFELGKTYDVSVNDAAYSLVCKERLDPTFGYLRYLGNAYFLGGENTGEPFIILDCVDFSYFCICAPYDGEYAVKIEGDVTTHHKVDLNLVSSPIRFLDIYFEDAHIDLDAMEVSRLLEQNVVLILRKKHTGNLTVHYMPFTYRDAHGALIFQSANEKHQLTPSESGGYDIT